MIHTITKQQALTADTFHWGNCSRTIGKRGGKTESSYTARRNGRTQTWKRDPNRWRVPIKRGLYEYGDITPDRAHEWHVPEDCPLNHVEGEHTATAHNTRVQPVTIPMLGKDKPWFRGVCTCKWTSTEFPTHVQAEQAVYEHAREISPEFAATPTPQ